MIKKKEIPNYSKVRDDRNKSLNNLYPPKIRTDYEPSQDDVESATGVDFPINMPNPTIDPIVSNNIANQEFDYTQDMRCPDNDEIDDD